jgi:prepilin-type N-terminal cleavage/methylation domain-containing protein
MKKQKTSKLAFTLIELLTVVAIIGILIALLFPAITTAIKKAEKAKAQAAVTGLATAFKAYYAEFNRWPASATGNITTGIFTNSRGIVFFDFPAKDWNISGSVTNYVDPWKQTYRFAADTNYQNYVTVNGSNINISVAVWSKGPDGTEYNADDVKNW